MKAQRTMYVHLFDATEEEIEAELNAAVFWTGAVPVDADRDADVDRAYRFERDGHLAYVLVHTVKEDQ